MDIIVTTPKSEMANAAQEAAECLAAGGGEYFRRFPRHQRPRVEPGDRVYYIEDGFLRGFAVIHRIEDRLSRVQVCDTTNRHWPPGFYVFMRADSWKWIRPIPMRGFQGFRYPGSSLRATAGRRDAILLPRFADIVIVGGWLDPRPEGPCLAEQADD